MIYIALYSVYSTAQRALYFSSPGRPVHSDIKVLGLVGKHSSHAAIMRNDYSLIFPPLSIARYSFIQLSQQGRQLRGRICPIFETVATGSLDCESGILPLSYRAPQYDTLRQKSQSSGEDEVQQCYYNNSSRKQVT